MFSKKITIIYIALLFFTFVSNRFATEGISAPVLEEMAKYHQILLKEKNDKIDTSQIVSILNKGKSSKKDLETIKKAIPIAEKLGKSKDLEEQRKYYSELTEAVSSFAGSEDKSGVNIFYCPMVKKKWMAKGDKIENPYGKDMRECGEKIENPKSGVRN